MSCHSSSRPQYYRRPEGSSTKTGSLVEEETGRDDPFLADMSDNDKAALVSLMVMKRHQTGKRGKEATSFAAGIHYRFARAMQSTTFLDAAIARSSCLMKPDELRVKKDKRPSDSVKLPVCGDIMRVRLWIQDNWSDGAIRARQCIWRACTLSSLLVASGNIRTTSQIISTSPNITSQVRVNDFTFTVESAGSTKNGQRTGTTQAGGFDQRSAVCSRVSSQDRHIQVEDHDEIVADLEEITGGGSVP